MAELIDFVRWSKEFGIDRIIFNGSFVTGKLKPQDVDVIILPAPHVDLSNLPNDLVFPFLQILIAADHDDLETWSLQDFGTDRHGNRKGVIELIL